MKGCVVNGSNDAGRPLNCDEDMFGILDDLAKHKNWGERLERQGMKKDGTFLYWKQKHRKGMVNNYNI